MNLDNTLLSMDINEYGVKISVRDTLARVDFLDINIRPEQFFELLHSWKTLELKCDMNLYNIDKVGKKKEIKEWRCIIPEFIGRDDYGSLINYTFKIIPEGWELCNKSFKINFDDKVVKVDICRWVDI